jgi:thiosulfate/3-mercaptopyruvate sulfurtransferase
MGQLSGTLSRRQAGGVLAGAAAVFAAACGGAAPNASSATGSASGTTYANPNLIVSVQWLRDHAKDAKLRIVDARSAADDQKGHIPGAVNLPVTETFDPSKDKNYPDTKEKLEALFGGKGIGNDVHIITYDNGTGSDTQGSRLFWTLEYCGHQNVSLLNGGVKSWQAAQNDLSTDLPAVETAKFVSKIDPAKLPTTQQCQLAIGDKTKVILDARSPEEYRGEDVRAKFGGHIPGAVNVDYRTNFTSDGAFKDAATLRSMYESKGVTKDKEVIALCQTGQRSSVAYLTLRLLGYPKVGNYAGSWIEWGNDAALPKVQGS